MTNSRPLKVLAVLVALSLSASGRSWAAQEAGTIRLPKAIKWQGKVVDKGTYKVAIADSSDGPEVVLATPSGTVASELAIVQETKRAAAKPHASVSTIMRGGPFVRILVTAGNKKYWAYFEPAA